MQLNGGYVHLKCGLFSIKLHDGCTWH